MFIQNTLDIINTFLERYVPHICEQGDYTDIKTIDEKVSFTFNNKYCLLVWIEDGELHIENERGESIFDYADCTDWTENEVYYIKFGYDKIEKIIRDNFKLSKEDIETAAKDIVDRCFVITGVPKDEELFDYISEYLNR